MKKTKNNIAAITIITSLSAFNYYLLIDGAIKLSSKDFTMCQNGFKVQVAI